MWSSWYNGGRAIGLTLETAFGQELNARPLLSVSDVKGFGTLKKIKVLYGTFKITQLKHLSQVTFSTHIALQIFEVKILASGFIQLSKSFFRPSCSP
ncbi:unnamed protein product [Rotaria magnacalcarata]|uniref:Uncharacterized protein n=1 Tax=Rotaria magnacalcarata TaxID=392030 RepID=A0A8S2QHT2_9BILA|nr:unnamed protein product [Rotaria magnacalcarata]